MQLNRAVQIYDVLPDPLFYSLKDDMLLWEHNNISNLGDYKSWGRAPDWAELAFLDAAIHIKFKIQKILKENVRCCRIHFNGQTVGQHSSFHTDFTQHYFWTFIFFSQDYWDTEWGGEFVCFNDELKEYQYFPYVPNSGVLIQSNWEHQGRQPTAKNQDAFRTTIAYCYIAESVIDYHLQYEADPTSHVWRMLS